MSVMTDGFPLFGLVTPESPATKPSVMNPDQRAAIRLAFAQLQVVSAREQFDWSRSSLVNVFRPSANSTNPERRPYRGCSKDGSRRLVEWTLATRGRIWMSQRGSTDCRSLSDDDKVNAAPSL